MSLKQNKGEYRIIERLREQYEIEKELATRLRNASRQERRHLYSSLYDEMYRRIPDHPQLVAKSSSQKTLEAISWQMGLLKRFLRKDITFLEVGPGNCALSFAVAKYVKKVYAVDVSEEITKNLTIPQNFQLVLSDGCDIPVPANSIDIAYSNQLMEHLHPDDALEQLQGIFNALTSRGFYICITPNRFAGPSDISRYFDDVATGFHLKEYTVTELTNLFQKVGFKKIKVFIGASGKYIISPVFPVNSCERFLSNLPYKLTKKIARSLPLRVVLGIRLIGTK